MKFWKHTLYFFSILFTVSITVFYSSCEQDPCSNQSCLHGGSCGNGVCTCPVGYDGPRCENKSVNRFVGVFAGYTSVNNGAYLIDTAFVLADAKSGPMSVKFIMHNNPIDTLSGTVQLDHSTWTIYIPTINLPNDTKIYTVTLQSTTKLSVETYEDNKTNPTNEIINHGTFLGFLTTIK